MTTLDIIAIAISVAFLFFAIIMWKDKFRRKRIKRQISVDIQNAILRRSGYLAFALLALSAHAQIQDSSLMRQPIPFHEQGSRLMPAMVLTLGGQVTQSNNTTTIEGLPNLPQAGSITNSSIDVGIGVLGALGGAANAVENIVEGRYHFTQTFFVGLEIQNGPASSVIDKAGGQFGVSKRWDQAEVYGMVTGRRCFTTTDASGAQKPAWEIGAGGGFSYRPITSGILQMAALFSETQAIYRTSGSKTAELETRAGVRYFF